MKLFVLWLCVYLCVCASVLPRRGQVVCLLVIAVAVRPTRSNLVCVFPPHPVYVDINAALNRQDGHNELVFSVFTYSHEVG